MGDHYKIITVVNKFTYDHSASILVINGLKASDVGSYRCIAFDETNRIRLQNDTSIGEHKDIYSYE